MGHTRGEPYYPMTQGKIGRERIKQTTMTTELLSNLV
jgi:hypothetical protein